MLIFLKIFLESYTYIIYKYIMYIVALAKVSETPPVQGLLTAIIISQLRERVLYRCQRIEHKIRIIRKKILFCPHDS